MHDGTRAARRIGRPILSPAEIHCTSDDSL